MSGKHLTGTVIYGYLWDEKREHWLVDEEAAEVVRRIFSLTLAGYGPYQIACKLSADRIEIPVVHLARFNEGVNRSKPVKDPYGWGSSTIVNILKKREYLGHTINFKTRKHFKDKKSHYVYEDEWTIFENTHEAIIDQQTFDLVQKIRSNVRRYPNGWGEAAPLTGLLYCADCGGKMYVHRTDKGSAKPPSSCPDRNGTSLTTGSRSGKGYRVLAYPLSSASRFTTYFCIQKNRRAGFPIRRQTVYLPNKSLCVPVRASVSTRTSSSMR